MVSPIVLLRILKHFLPDDAIPLLGLVVEHPVQIVGHQVEGVVEASNLSSKTELKIL